MDELRVGILGNSFATKVQLPALRAVGGCRVVGLAGADPEKARRVAAETGIELGTGDWREVLALEADLVLVSTPVHLHREMVLAALGTPAAILCEKPFALDASEAAKLVERAAGRAAWIDHQLRWSPVRRALRTELDRGAIGELWHVEMDFSIPSPGFESRPYRWWYDRERGGGILGAIGSHMVDLLRCELGEVAAVRAQLDTLVRERPDADGTLREVTADEHATLGLRFASGVRADLVTSLATREGRLFHTRYTGSAGTLLVEREERLLYGTADAEELTPLAGAPTLPTAAEVSMPDFGPFARCFPLYLADLVDAVRAERTEVPGAATFADGLAVQRVLDAARRSHDTGGGWVDLGA